MERVELSAVINRPIEEVFEFVTNIRNAPVWQSGISEAEQTSHGPIGVGSTVRIVGRFLGKRIEATSECTEYVPNSRFATKRTSGPVMPFKAETRFASMEGGTKITFVAEGESRGFFKIADPIVTRMAKRQAEADLANLNDLLQARAEVNV